MEAKVSRGERAEDSLELIFKMGNRARILQQKSWILLASFGSLMLLAAILLANTHWTVSSCYVLVGHLQKPATCTLGPSGSLLKVASPLNYHPQGPVSIMLTGKVDPTWPAANSAWFWIAGIAMCVSAPIVLRRRFSSSNPMRLTHLIAAMSGILVLVVSKPAGLPPQDAHLLAVAVVICMVALFTKESPIAFAAGLSFFAGIFLFSYPNEFLSRLNVLLSSPGQSYIAAGLTLIGCSIALKLRSRATWTVNLQEIDDQEPRPSS